MTTPRIRKLYHIDHMIKQLSELRKDYPTDVDLKEAYKSLIEVKELLIKFTHNTQENGNSN